MIDMLNRWRAWRHASVRFRRGVHVLSEDLHADASVWIGKRATVYLNGYRLWLPQGAKMHVHGWIRSGLPPAETARKPSATAFIDCFRQLPAYPESDRPCTPPRDG